MRSDTPSGRSHTSHTDLLTERRARSRLAVHLEASLRQRGSSRSPVRILDLSTHGCRLELITSVGSESCVWLYLPGLSAQFCRVAWSHDSFAGLQFSAPLHQSVVDQLIVANRLLDPAEITQLRSIAIRCHLLAARATYDVHARELSQLAAHCEAQVSA
jgi:hypothetical protein